MKDDWIKKTKGGKRKSVYSKPPTIKAQETRLQRFKREAMEFSLKRIDRMTK